MSSVLSTEQSNRSSVLGVGVDILDDYVKYLVERIHSGQGTHVVTLNAEMTMQTSVDHELAKIIQNAELVVPDGAGIVLYFKLYGRQITRCPGIELSAALIRQMGTMPQASLYFYGGAPGIVEKAAERWQRELPELSIVGLSNGYVQGPEEDQLKQSLQQLQPNLIFVGLGVPRQEYWIAEHRHLCPNAVWVGVGGSFDIWSESKQRAPKWLCDNNLEWTYRLYQEPTRWRRMLALPQFAGRALIERFTSSR